MRALILKSHKKKTTPGDLGNPGLITQAREDAAPPACPMGMPGHGGPLGGYGGQACAASSRRSRRKMKNKDAKRSVAPRRTF